MPKFYSFPHHEVNVKDESVRFPLVVEQLALHRPIFLSFAERGPVGIPVYGSSAELKSRFGAGTFDVFGAYYKHPTLFLEKSLASHKSFFVRLASDTAKSASLVLEARVYHKNLIQYQKNVAGLRIKDVNGNYIPIDDSGAPLKEPGTVVKWMVRSLALNENPNSIVPAASSIPNPDGGANLVVTTYPVAVFTASSPGAWGNNTAFKFYSDVESDTSVASAMKALIYSFGIVEIPWGFDSPAPVRTKYLQTATEFTFMEGTVDKTTMRRYALNEVIENEYNSDAIPFSVKVYSANVKAIGAACLQYELPATFPELTSEYMVNLFTGKGFSNLPYDHINIDFSSAGAILMDSNVNNYMRSGSDGDLTDAGMEDLTREWLSGTVFPEIHDSAQFPITHLWDSGYEAATKESMIDFLGVRDDVKIMLATQSVYNEPNTKAEDQSMGSFLRGRALLHPESFIYGTMACRVTIQQQCGKLAELSNYTRIVPSTLDNLVKKGKWQGAVYMKGKPKGLPHSAVTVLKDINWVPVMSDFKQQSWDNALNYMQYYDMTSLHYPDVISIYPYLTSLLSDDIFTDMLVYIKHIVRFQWAKFAGVDDPIAQLIGDIKESVGREIYGKLGNFLRAEVNPYQTELDVELGYALTVEIPVYGTIPNRVWNVIVPVRREVVA